MSDIAVAAKTLHKGFALAFEKLRGKTILQGKVLSVNGDTCDVELQPGLEMYAVRIHAVDAGLSTYMTVKPKQGSQVLVAVIENLRTEGYLLACSEVDEVSVKIGTAEFKVNASKIKIAAEGENLKAQLDAIIEEVKKIVVLYGRGPNVPALNTIKSNIGKILQ